jgi:hypothetical protein
MTAQDSLQTQGSIKDYFSIEGHVAATRTADGYSALDLSRNQHVTLWLVREMFPLDSEVVRLFLRRLMMIDAMEPRITDIIGFGVDCDGVGFAVMNPLDGAPIIAGNVEPAEAERRFLACVNLVARLHEQGIVCGDLGGSSFSLLRTGDVKFVGIAGAFERSDILEQAASAHLPIETLHFLAPEQSQGGMGDYRADVFALGVLGFALLARRFPFGGQPLVMQGNPGDIPNALPESIVSMRPDMPAWADDILGRCLAIDKAQRFESAVTLREEIQQVRQKLTEGKYYALQTSGRSSASARAASGATATSATMSGDGVAVTGNTNGVANSTLHDTQVMQPASNIALLRSRLSRPRLRRMLTAAFVGAVIFMAVAYIAIRQNDDSPMNAGLVAHRFVAHRDISKAIEELAREDVPFQQQEINVETLAASDDPVAHDVLLTAARDTHSEAFRRLAERALLDRARRLGLTRSADEIATWISTLRGSQTLPAQYEPLLKSLDVTLPIEARNAAIRQAYAGDPKFTLRLAAALALDSTNITEYQPVIGQLVGDALRLDDAVGRSVLALILASQELTAAYGDDVIQRKEQLPDADVLWALGVLAERSDPRVRAFANLALDRGLVSPLRQKFLIYVRDRSDLPVDVLLGLVAAGRGVLQVDQISAFGRWYDVSVEPILYAVCADQNDTKILLEAFDTVASRSLSIEPGAGLVEWVRANYWDDRAAFAHAIGVLTNVESVEAQEIQSALDIFDRFAKDTELIGIFLETANPAIVKPVIARYRDLVGVGRLLNLLNNSDPDIRLTAIDALKDYNDVGALRLIIDGYERERDPRVKKAYETSFWVIKERLRTK